MFVQVFLVVGGYHLDYPTASTELLVHGSSAWTEAAALPRAMGGLQAVSVGNLVISTGEYGWSLSPILF